MPFARRFSFAATVALAALIPTSVHTGHAAHHLRANPLAAALSQGQALDDATIVAIFDAANTADIETGELATRKGQSKDVRDLAAHFAGDHKAVRQQGRDLAQKLGVTPTPPRDDPSAKQHAQAMASLSARSGAAFDLAWAQHEAAYHAAVIDAITKTLLPAIRSAELKALVEKVAPAFQAHLAAAQALEKKLSGK
jgi:putative membrane protein